ncbi:TetR/AcrR family transcriptional regulator [Paractinoplanes ferrugineus]|uniref:TetR family transcriptional regulator n=1 Tax=Paractinoplanes ferrugineus TaxID=113564 RepID=A0A919J0N1_9ACTN|nr:TetR/AcrR family transcriptional regulator [Actinoplanes ferrugineus]GIE11322.1 TetR family transcriptional regulator [Actinoplanes ferrugineus]
MEQGVRELMIDGAVRLLGRHGLQGTSFTEVLAATGTPRGSIYHHFPGGKEQLVGAALEAAGAETLQGLGGLKGADPERVAQRYVGLWRDLLVRSRTGAGSAVLAVTVATRSEEMLTRAAAVFRSWRERLTELLADGGHPDPAGFAATLVAACEGAVVLSRAERSLEPFDAVAAFLLAEARDATPRGSGG